MASQMALPSGMVWSVRNRSSFRVIFHTFQKFSTTARTNAMAIAGHVTITNLTSGGGGLTWEIERVPGTDLFHNFPSLASFNSANSSGLSRTL